MRCSKALGLLAIAACTQQPFAKKKPIHFDLWLYDGHSECGGLEDVALAGMGYESIKGDNKCVTWPTPATEYHLQYLEPHGGHKIEGYGNCTFYAFEEENCSGRQDPVGGLTHLDNTNYVCYEPIFEVSSGRIECHPPRKKTEEEEFEVNQRKQDLKGEEHELPNLSKGQKWRT